MRQTITITPDPNGTTTPLEIPKRGRPGLLGNDAMLLQLLQRIANQMANTDADLSTQAGALSSAVSALQGESTSLDGRLDTLEGQNLNSRISTLENAQSAITRVALFGMGSDGNVSLDGTVAAPSWATKSGSTYRMNRDVFVNNLTLTSTARIITNGFRLFVAGTLTLTNAAARAISNDGADRQDNTGRTVGAGGAGGIFSADLPTNGETTHNNGGAGGRGAGTGFQAGITTANPVLIGRAVTDLMHRGLLIGGGSGGGAGGNPGGNGGAGGGVLALFANTIAVGGSTPANVISAAGANGANATNGGGGGGGGWVWLLYANITGGSVVNGITVAGGAVGTGGTGAVAGAAGRITKLNVTTGVFAETFGTAQVNL